MKIKEIRRIVVEDFPAKYRDLIQPLAFAINPFLESVINALNKQLSFQDNFNCQVSDFNFRADIDPNNPISLRTTIRGKALGIIPLAVLNTDNNNATITAGVSVDFIQKDDSLVQIRKITGLTAGTNYSIKLLIIGS